MYLGIDIGTSSVKAVLIDGDQRIVASRSASLEVSRPHPGWSEQDPESWSTASSSRARRARRDHPKEMARGQGHRPLRPHARRDAARRGRTGRSAPASSGTTGARPRRRRSSTRDPRFREITGNIVLPGFTAPKLVWVQRHEPEIFAKVADGAAAEGLCAAAGSPATTPPTCRIPPARRGSTSPKRDWSDELLARDRPRPRPDAGALRGHRSRPASSAPMLATRWGMTATPVVAGGGGDNAASACGVGTVAPGTGFVSLGTSGVLFVSNDRFRPNPASAVHAFCHALPDTWHQMGVILSAAGSLEWLAGVHRADAGRSRRSRSASTPARSRRRSSSCPTSPASARRTTTPRARGASSASTRRHGRDARPRRAGGRRLRLRRLPRRADQAAGTRVERG